MADEFVWPDQQPELSVQQKSGSFLMAFLKITTRDKNKSNDWLSWNFFAISDHSTQFWFWSHARIGHWILRSKIWTIRIKQAYWSINDRSKFIIQAKIIKIITEMWRMIHNHVTIIQSNLHTWSINLIKLLIDQVKFFLINHWSWFFWSIKFTNPNYFLL